MPAEITRLKTCIYFVVSSYFRSSCFPLTRRLTRRGFHHGMRFSAYRGYYWQNVEWNYIVETLSIRGIVLGFVRVPNISTCVCNCFPRVLSFISLALNRSFLSFFNLIPTSNFGNDITTFPPVKPPPFSQPSLKHIHQNPSRSLAPEISKRATFCQVNWLEEAGFAGPIRRTCTSWPPRTL